MSILKWHTLTGLSLESVTSTITVFTFSVPVTSTLSMGLSLGSTLYVTLGVSSSGSDSHGSSVGSFNPSCPSGLELMSSIGKSELGVMGNGQTLVVPPVPEVLGGDVDDTAGVVGDTEGVPAVVPVVTSEIYQQNMIKNQPLHSEALLHHRCLMYQQNGIL